MPDAIQPSGSDEAIPLPNGSDFKEAISIRLNPEEAQWILDKAKAEYVDFLENYERRDYHKQQSAERVAAALGIRLTMFINSDNTYSISQSKIDLITPGA